MSLNPPKNFACDGCIKPRFMSYFFKETPDAPLEKTYINTITLLPGERFSSKGWLRTTDPEWAEPGEKIIFCPECIKRLKVK